MIEKIVEKTEDFKIYIGCREGHHGKEFSEAKLLEVIGEFQCDCEDYAPVRVTRLCYVDRHYNEGGWEIAASNYPRRPRTKAQLEKFCSDLATHLLQKLNQTRLTLVSKKKTVVFQVKI